MSDTQAARRPSEALADNVRHWRGVRRLSQGGVAQEMRKLGHRWHQQSVSGVESGRRPVTTDELVSLALVLRATVAQLLEPDPGVRDLTLDQAEDVEGPGGYVLGDPDGDGVALPLAYAKMVARSQVPIGFDGRGVDLPKAGPYFPIYDHYGVEVEGMDQWRRRKAAQ